MGIFKNYSAQNKNLKNENEILRNRILKLEESQSNAKDSFALELLNSTTIAIVLADVNEKIIEVNTEYASRFGKSREELHNTNIYAEYPEDIAKVRRQMFQKVLETKLPHTFIDNREGLWNLHQMNPIKNSKGEIVRIAIYGLNITEQRKAEIELEKSEKLFNTTVNSLSDYIHVIDKDFRILLANEACINQNKLIGFPTAIINKKLMEVYPFDNKKILDEYKEVFENGEILSTQEILSFNGKEYYTETKKIPLFENGEITRIITAIKDITHIKVAEKELEEALVTRDKFLSILAHDLINPINAVWGISEILKNEFDTLLPEKKTRFISAICDSLKQTSTLLENLLTWSRSQRNQISYLPEELKVGDLVEESITLLKNSATQKEISIVIQGNKTNKIIADKDMLGTVIRNLLSNAIKFTNRGGTITIGHKKADAGEIEIFVKDNGIGIVATNIAKLLKIDEDFMSVGTEKERGTGLGLILCQDFLRKHNSNLNIKSEEGSGSTFSFRVSAAN
jgi:PAS domain S-box-containing protein